MPCVPNFSADTTFCYEPCIIDFTDQSTGDITGWLWDFGIGLPSTQQNPSHYYGINGYYTVSLTVYGPDCPNGVTETKVDYIHITGCGG